MLDAVHAAADNRTDKQSAGRSHGGVPAARRARCRSPQPRGTPPGKPDGRRGVRPWASVHRKFKNGHCRVLLPEAQTVVTLRRRDRKWERRGFLGTPLSPRPGRWLRAACAERHQGLSGSVHASSFSQNVGRARCARTDLSGPNLRAGHPRLEWGWACPRPRPPDHAALRLSLPF